MIYNRLTAVAFAALLYTGAMAHLSGINVSNPDMVRDTDKMNVSMDITFDSLKVKSTGAVVIMPLIVNGADTLHLPTIGIYGRTSWYTSRRNDRMPLGGVDGDLLRYNKNLEPIHYSQTVDYADWMNGSELVVQQASYGCAGCDDGVAEVTDLARYKKVEYEPVLMYEAVVAGGVKTRELNGRAFVDFPVNLVEIFPEYRNNTVELAKIIATIDSVRNDEDITVNRITIKGYASPESPYSNNTRLAMGRTAALKKYVNTLYHFDDNFILTDFEPEDWEGLREFVESSNLEHRTEILALIDDTTLQPDPKEALIKKTYPEEYKFLLMTIYPALRHSDYTINYTIRSFTDPVEIREIIKTQPQKLSLDEFYVAIQGLEPGTDEYNQIFETAVRMYPDVPAANLNAANAAIQRGDYVSAERYLLRAGNTPRATYARGVLAGMTGDLKTAQRLIEQAVAEGLEVDQAVLDNIRAANM
ncbi:MAG: DUF3868 domain-containing protein [Muribaculaceae bacterium]|nr:DUF3868 domain-containing protein [Muribaculaceae bacterium]